MEVEEGADDRYSEHPPLTMGIQINPGLEFSFPFRYQSPTFFKPKGCYYRYFSGEISSPFIHPMACRSTQQIRYVRARTINTRIKSIKDKRARVSKLIYHRTTDLYQRSVHSTEKYSPVSFTRAQLSLLTQWLKVNIAEYYSARIWCSQESISNYITSFTTIYFGLSFIYKIVLSF